MYKNNLSLNKHVFFFTKGEFNFFFDKENLGIYPFVYEVQEDNNIYNNENKTINFSNELLAKIGITKMQGVDIEQSLREELNQHEGYFYLCAKKNEIYSVQLEVTERCNLNCVHCYNKNLVIRNELSLDEVIKIIDILEAQKVVVLTLTGGEFFLHPQWKEILEYVSKKPFFVFIISNLTMLNSDMVQILAEKKFIHIQTSLYGATGELHDSITGNKGSFKKTIENIKLLRNLGIDVVVNYMIMKNNYNDVFLIKNLLEPLGIKINFDYRIYPTRNLDYSVLENRIEKSVAMELLKKGILTSQKEIECYACKSKMRVDAKGNVFPCEFINTSYGNLLITSWDELRNSSLCKRIQEGIDNFFPDSCKKCVIKNECSRCPSLIWNEGEMFLKNESNKLMCLYPRLIEKV